MKGKAVAKVKVSECYFILGEQRKTWFEKLHS